MTLDELRKLVTEGEFNVERDTKVIEQGEMKDRSGTQVKYCVRHGWDMIAAAECDEIWGRAKLELFEYIRSQNFDEDTLKQVLESIQMEDFHWDWFNKSYHYSRDEYEWFFLFAEGKPQGACVIYHPKMSELAKAKIFYVEYLAVAPWNRDCMVMQREFKGVGSTLLKAALRYSVDVLGLTPGFSLHSLPQAKQYYERLNMVNIEKNDKGKLLYFELPTSEANLFLGAV